MNSKNNKKKILILALLLFIIVGFAGYGVYSYLYAQKDFSGSDTVSVVAFDPEVEISSSENFLGSGGTVELSCPTSSSGNGTVTCTQELEVKNNGGTNITVTVTPGDSDEYNENHYFEGEASSPTFNWTSRTLSPNETSLYNLFSRISLTLPIATDTFWNV